MPKEVDVDAAESANVGVRNPRPLSPPCISQRGGAGAQPADIIESTAALHHHTRGALAGPFEAVAGEPLSVQLVLLPVISGAAAVAIVSSLQCLGEVETGGFVDLGFFLDRGHAAHLISLGGIILLEAGEVLETEVDGVVGHPEVEVFELLPRVGQGACACLVPHSQESD